MSQQPPSSRSIIDRFLAERDQLRRAIEVTGLAFRGVARSDIPRMAAALAYRTIFSLIPVLVVGLAVAGSFVKPDQVRSQVERLLEVTGLSEITVSQGVLEPGADTNTESDTLSSDDEDARDSDIGNANNADGTPPDSVTGGVPGAPAEGTEGRLASDASPEAGVSIGQASALDPMTEEQLRLDEWITALVDRVQDIRLEAIGLIGVLFLIWAAISMLVELERAFDSVCGSKRKRSWARRITTYWTTLTLGILLLLATFAGGEQAGERVARALANADGPAWAGELVTPAINLVINTGLLMLAFMTIPTTRVTFRSALVGAVVAGTLFEAAKALFGLYLQSGGVERLYGAVALLPLFLLWVYVTWVIVLLGLQIAHAMQHFNTWVERTAAGPDDGMIVDPAVGVAVATLLARGFASGTSVRQEQIESTTGMPAGVVSKVVERLVDAGIAHRIAADEDDSTAALARSPDSILVADVLAAAERLDRSAANDDTGTVALLLSERRKAVGTETLASLIARNPVAAGRATTSGGPAGSPAAPHQPENSSVARAEEQG